MQALGAIGGLGFQFGLTILLGALLGYYLDRRWGTSPWLILAGTLAGTAAGFWQVINALKGYTGKGKGASGR
jgi:F0F1-type ATP synthase assembly protein I